MAASYYGEDALDHIEDLPYTISQIELDAPRDEDDNVNPLFVHLSGERIFTFIYDTLYVYSVREP
jgi:hypothetical protein